MKNELWNSILDADMNERYWGYLSRRYYDRDIKSKIFLAVMASGTVAGWGIWEHIEPLWKILSGLSAVTAIALPILNWPKKIKNITQLRQKWSKIKSEYELIWIEMKNDDSKLSKLKKNYKTIKSEESKVSQLDSNLPFDEKLREKCYNEVIESRGL